MIRLGQFLLEKIRLQSELICYKETESIDNMYPEATWGGRKIIKFGSDAENLDKDTCIED